jgi:hypothetical protein
MQKHAGKFCFKEANIVTLEREGGNKGHAFSQVVF